MKVVILAGGFGTRLAEETDLRPKPMVTVGGRPLLWHIMKLFSHYGHEEFVVCLGYKGEVIKEYFANYLLYAGDVTIDLANNDMEVLHRDSERWRVTLVDTGQDTPTAGRIRRVFPHLGNERFFMTYGDGVADLDLDALLAGHEESGRIATVTAVRPPARFGTLHLEDGGVVREFSEKPSQSAGWINGGFFVLEPAVLDYLQDDVMFEREPLERLASDDQLFAFRHEGFWLGMDTMRDRRWLESLWESGQAAWKVWRS